MRTATVFLSASTLLVGVSIGAPISLANSPAKDAALAIIGALLDKKIIGANVLPDNNSHFAASAPVDDLCCVR
ncbi:hypothetical protein B0H34DRAFT_255533 [Crassisporium funariophilum]|nr:hypothetical protein B0H34DRAFT_255533 [Crassisporium funariophilum]